jgi:hypothetical protein
VRKKSLSLFLVAFLLLASCSREEFVLVSSTLLPVHTVVLDKEGNKSEENDLLVALSLSGCGKETVDMELSSPSGYSWSFRSKGKDVDGIVYYGNERLEDPSPSSGVYHVKAMLDDGRVVESDLPLKSKGKTYALPDFIRDGKRVTWEGGKSLSWAQYDGNGAELSKGNANGMVDLAAAATLITFSLWEGDELSVCRMEL